MVGTARRYRVHLDTGDVELICAGRPERFRRLLSRVFPGGVALEAVTTRVPLWNPHRFSAAYAPAVAVEIHPAFAEKFRAAGWLTCPDLVRWRGAVADMPPAHPDRSLRIDLRRVEKAGYVLQEAAGSRPEWDEFRRDMLVPHALRRFGENANIPVPALLRKLEKDGTLLFLVKRGRRVAGQAVLRNRDEAWLAALGVKDGDPNLMKEGAVAGLYALTIDWAREHGVRYVDAGRSPAFALHGLAEYKRKWGMSPAREPFSHMLALRVDPAHQGVRLALQREPFWIDRGSGELEIFPPR